MNIASRGGGPPLLHSYREEGKCSFWITSLLVKPPTNFRQTISKEAKQVTESKPAQQPPVRDPAKPE